MSCVVAEYGTVGLTAVLVTYMSVYLAGATVLQVAIEHDSEIGAPVESIVVVAIEHSSDIGALTFPVSVMYVVCVYLVESVAVMSVSLVVVAMVSVLPALFVTL